MKESLLEKRKETFIKACNHEKVDYVPSLMCGGNALLAYAGLTYWDVERNEEKYKQSLANLFDKMHCDAALQVYSGSPRAHEALDGRTETFLAADGVTPQHLQQDKMRDDEYDQLIENPFKFISDVLVPRKYPNLFNGDKKAATDALKAVAEETVQNVITGPAAKNTQFLEELNVVYPISPQHMIFQPMDMIFDFFRGFTGTLADLRRRPQAVKDACEVLWNTICNHFEDLDFDFPFVSHAPHIPSYISPKQFYEFYWPYSEKMFRNISKSGNKTFIGMEGRWGSVIECYLDLPKDSTLLIVDEDDLFEINKKVGHHQPIAGGIRIQDIRLASKEKNIDNVKKAIDECAPGGGFILCSDKTLTCAGDVNDTYVDVYNFAHEYGMNK